MSSSGSSHWLQLWCGRWRRRLQSRQVEAEKIANALDRDIGRHVADNLGVTSIAALSRKNSRDAVSPEALDRRQDARFVVDKHVMFGWKTPLDVVKGLFLMDVDEDASIDRIENASPFDFARLKDDVSDRKSTRLNSSHRSLSRMPSSA